MGVNSVLEDHGLDSFDSIELAMQVEEDLGYVISAETIPVLNKVKHFVNYINHVEQFKAENGKAPLAWETLYLCTHKANSNSMERILLGNVIKSSY